jgi:[ribosomal protein S5]-alanine N-acetyltransferase
MKIVTPSAVLRDWRPEDAASLARHADSPRIAAAMRDGFPSPYTLEDARRFIAAATGLNANLVLAIELDGEAVGGIGVHPLGDVYCRTAEIGYWLAESCRGRGIATDAVRAIVPAAFARFGIVRLQAGVFSNNPASMRVLEKAGFVREAVHANAIWKHGRLLDEVVYVRFGPDVGR